MALLKPSVSKNINTPYAPTLFPQMSRNLILFPKSATFTGRPGNQGMSTGSCFAAPQARKFLGFLQSRKGETLDF